MAGSVAFPHQLSELALEAGNSPFELVHPVAKRGDLALDELPRAVANALIDLCRGLLERFPRESIVEHVSSSGAGPNGTQPVQTANVGFIVTWMPKRTPAQGAIRPGRCTRWCGAARIMPTPAMG
jgi:hypothetical protein